MNEQELRDKIAKHICCACEMGLDDAECSEGNDYRKCCICLDVADALISAGIGDVGELQKECESKEEAYNKCYSDYKYWKDKAKEYKHRAEVAEAENTELKARLEKAVELPRIVHPNSYEWFVQYEMESGLLDYLIFYSKEAAEERLAELRGENEQNLRERKSARAKTSKND